MPQLGKGNESQIDEDQRINRNNRRIEIMQRRIDRFTEKKDVLESQNTQLMASKAAKLEALNKGKNPLAQ